MAVPGVLEIVIGAAVLAVIFGMVAFHHVKKKRD